MNLNRLAYLTCTMLCKYFLIIIVILDDMIVKNMTSEQHIKDPKEVFFILDRCQMKLNPFKCVFAIKGGKYLGFLVNSKGKEPNPDKI